MGSLVESVEKLRPGTVAVVGLAKNCGKTTALNHLVKEYTARQAGVAVTSAGRDGEERDALTMQPKPPVELPEGALAATAEDTLKRWKASYRVVTRLGVESPMGEILVVEATEEGDAEIAGPPKLESVMDAVRELRKLGAKRVLIDGAFDRIAVGHPGLSDAVVLAAGAVLAASPLSVARIVAEKVDLLSLSSPPRGFRGHLMEIAENLGPRAAAVTDDFRVNELPDTVLLGPNEAAEAARGARWLVCGGALTYELVEILMAGNVEVDLVARDATRVFISRNCLRRWEETGRKMHVLAPLSLAAVVTNPHNPTGSDLDPQRLVDETAQRLKRLPVFDVVAGLQRNT